MQIEEAAIVGTFTTEVPTEAFAIDLHKQSSVHLFKKEFEKHNNCQSVGEKGDRFGLKGYNELAT